MSFLPTNRNQQKYYKTTDEPRELTCDDLAFVSQYTGKSPDDLRQHVINVWRTTKEQTWAFKCIQDFYFLLPCVQLHPHYQAVSAAHKQRSSDQKLLHLDVGCCYGQDTRQLMTDGWKEEELVAIDLVPAYWSMGKALFMDEDRLQVPFLAGSMADSAFVSASSPSGTPTEHLLGAADFCLAGAVLHCLSKADCKSFLRNCRLLLKAGGSLYGWAVGFAEAREHVATPDGKAARFFHSPESLKETMLEVGFSKAEMHLLDSAEAARWKMLDDPDTVGMVFLCFTATN